MNEKNLRRLSRRDLLEMLLDLIKENEKLQKRNKQMEEILQDRVITILEAGSLAEASLQLNGVFQAAQNAADQYLFNVQKNCQKLEEDTRKKCEQMLLDAQSQGKDYEEKMNERPTAELLEAELNRVKYKHRYYTVLKSTLYTLITVAAAAVLVATLWLPVLQIYGSSMTPTLQDGEIVFSVKTADLEQGDIIAFYYNKPTSPNLPKRCPTPPAQCPFRV